MDSLISSTWPSYGLYVVLWEPHYLLLHCYEISSPTPPTHSLFPLTLSPAHISLLLLLRLTSTPKPKNRPPSPAAPKSRPLSPLVPAAASKTPAGKKTPPGTKTRPKRAQTPARVQPQTVTAVAVETGREPQQPDTPEEKKSECGCHGDDIQASRWPRGFWPTFVLQSEKQCEHTRSLQSVCVCVCVPSLCPICSLQQERCFTPLKPQLHWLNFVQPAPQEPQKPPCLRAYQTSRLFD